MGSGIGIGAGELARRRAASGLEPLLPVLRARLLPAAVAAGQVMVVVDPQGRVLWREGGDPVIRRGDHADSHQPLTCAAAPLHDPMTGKLLGVVDLSGPAGTVHAGTVALVDAVARLSVLELRARRDRRLDGLRALAAPLLAQLAGRALVVTPDGRVAAVRGMAAPERVTLPEGIGGGMVRLPVFGRCAVEPLPGGWLLRLLRTDPGDLALTALVVDLSGTAPRARFSGTAGGWEQVLSLRHAEILLALLRHPTGLSAAQLSGDLFGDPSHTVAVRAEMSRLRKTFGAVLLAKPYRLDSRVAATLILTEHHDLLLPASRAPIVEALRGR